MSVYSQLFRNFGVMPDAVDAQDADDFIGVFIASVKEAAKREKQSENKSAPSEATFENTPPHLWALYGLR